MAYDFKTIEPEAKGSGLKDLAYWGALIFANVACLGLMVMLLFKK
jgi:hypothetical protein